MVSDLEDRIRDGGIEFYSFGRKLSVDIDDFGEYNQDLIKHLAVKAGCYITVCGDGLEGYLGEPKNLFRMARFVVHLWYILNRRYSSSAAIHVDADIEAFDARYTQPKENNLINGLGHVVGNAAGWVPEIPYFEKCWNFALCDAVGGMVGYPGYEHPRNDESFRLEMATHAEEFMIGTPKQIARYKPFVVNHINTAITIVDGLKSDLEGMFDDDDQQYQLRRLSDAARSAEKIAANILHFSERQYRTA